MIESSITTKGQTTLPKAVRDALGVRPGDRVRYLIDDDVRILPVRSMNRLFGALKTDGPPATLDDMQRAIAEGATESDRVGYQHPRPHSA